MFSSKNTILKSNSKYLIIKKKINGKNQVIKISQQSGSNLKREYLIIKELKKKSKKFNLLMPQTKIFNQVKNSLKFFSYQQDFVKGFSLSSILKKKLNTKEKKNIQIIKNELFNISLENLSPIKNISNLNIFKKLILQEYEILIKKNHLKFLLKKKLIINNKEYLSLGFLLERVFNKKTFNDIDDSSNFFGKLGHFNFHGENIIIENLNDNSNFKIIDPDSRWEYLDPFFSLMRFFYTYEHDLIEGNFYHLTSNLFELSKNKNQINFSIKINLTKNIKANYKNVFDKENFFRSKNHIIKKRYLLNFLLCMLRGINSNYEENVNYMANNLAKFRHSSILLSLMTIQFIDNEILKK